jgi:hypothetical protein
MEENGFPDVRVYCNMNVFHHTTNVPISGFCSEEPTFLFVRKSSGEEGTFEQNLENIFKPMKDILFNTSGMLHT